MVELFFVTGALIFLGLMVYEMSKALYTIAGVLDERLKKEEDKS